LECLHFGIPLTAWTGRDRYGSGTDLGFAKATCGLEKQHMTVRQDKYRYLLSSVRTVETAVSDRHNIESTLITTEVPVTDTRSLHHHL